MIEKFIYCVYPNQRSEQHMPTSTHDFLEKRLGLFSKVVLALAAGALMPLSLAPLDWWLLAFIAPALLALLLYSHQDKATLFALSFAFGAGVFGVGASWVFVSIHQYGNASILLAGFLTLLFSLGLGLVFALPFIGLGWIKHTNKLVYLLAFTCIWVLGEWLRSWLLTGFPWLFIGYSQLSTGLVGLAPIGGIFLVSFGVLITAVLFASVPLQLANRHKVILLSITSVVWMTGFISTHYQWTTEQGDEISVAMIQANIAQEKKWLPEYRTPTLDTYRRLSQAAHDNDWVIWPEAAIPILYSQANKFLMDIDTFAEATDSALLTGILYDDRVNNRYHNSAVALGNGSGVYHKTRLVPFGEYVPLEKWLRGIIGFFNLPTSIISKGDDVQPELKMGEHKVGMAICYEIVYPDIVAQRAKNADVLMTLSNDAWFGASWGPLQHVQMAQMRAVENGRYLIRSTNNGVSAIIKPDGSMSATSQQFVQETLTGTVKSMTGHTWFTLTKSYPVVVLCFLILCAAKCLTFTKWS